jgi:hypothetical protein
VEIEGELLFNRSAINNLRHGRQESSFMTQCTAQTTFDFFHRLPVLVRSDAPDMSSDAGALLLRQLDDEMGLTRSLAAELPDDRRAERVRHDRHEQVRQRVFQIALGYEDCNDADTLRHDPALKIACDRQPKHAGLSSQPTLSRFENGMSGAAIGRLVRALERQWVESLRPEQQVVILDIDSSDDETHGQQQLSFFHGFYDHYMFHPLFVFDGDGQLVTAILRPGNQHASRGARGLLRRLIRKIRRRCPQAAIVVRADSGFAVPRVLRELERLNVQLGDVDYLMGMARNRALERRLAPTMEQVQSQQVGSEKIRRFCDFPYAAGSWSRSRRILGKAEMTWCGPNPRFVITSIEGFEPEDLYRAYCERGQAENYIKDLKRALKADRLSCHRFAANFFRLLLHATAYRLLFALRRIVGKVAPRLATVQFDTLRLRLLKIAGLVRQSVRRIVVQLPKSFPLTETFHAVAARIMAAPAPT